jgi:hypothetical protein
LIIWHGHDRAFICPPTDLPEFLVITTIELCGSLAQLGKNSSGNALMCGSTRINFLRERILQSGKKAVHPFARMRLYTGKDSPTWHQPIAQAHAKQGKNK